MAQAQPAPRQVGVDLGPQLLAGVLARGEAAREPVRQGGPVQPGRMAAPVPDLVDGGPVVGLPAGEPLRIGQLDTVSPEVVARAPRGRDIDPGDGQDPPDGRVVAPDGAGVVKARKALALLGVVDGAAEDARLPADRLFWGPGRRSASGARWSRVRQHAPDRPPG